MPIPSTSSKQHDRQSYTHEEWTMSSDERDTTLRSKTQPTRSETRANEGQDVNREERPATHENPTNEEQATTD
ncbi:hypothetical protein BDZ89DRAFT_1076290 [Hymenopellis radicata]|nr:hypothetical protein BDZ89DRAFT_1076290 [Hymenopellis radicata]